MSNTPENWIQKNRVLNVVSTVSSLFSVSVVIQKKNSFLFLGAKTRMTMVILCTAMMFIRTQQLGDISCIPPPTMLAEFAP